MLMLGVYPAGGLLFCMSLFIMLYSELLGITSSPAAVWEAEPLPTDAVGPGWQLD